MPILDYIVSFINTYNGSLATLITGGVAWFLYERAKKDELKIAAKTIILEIKDAEKVIKIYLDVKNSEGIYPTDFYKVTPRKAWEKYAHLFIKKLNNDEYQQVSEFYRKCESLEKYIEKNYNFFWVTTEERARQKERIGADWALHKSNENADGTDKTVEDIAKEYFGNTGAYVPAGIKTEIDKILNSMTLITNTPTWNCLKSIADYKDILG